MSQAEGFQSTTTEWIAAPEPTEGKPRQPSSTALALRHRPGDEAITSEAWRSPVVVLEEIQPPPALDPRLVVLHSPSSSQARSYRLLQHRLHAYFDPRVIAVTSACPGEGKTTCAANLALVLADETRSRVLLVDANLPRPGLATLFGFQPADSFIERLLWAEEAGPPYTVASLRGTRLHVAALRSSVTPGMRLDRSLLSVAMGELRRAYDYIVVDAAAVLESADVDVVSKCADGVVFAARAGKSRKGALRRAIEQLSPATVLGAVLLDT